LLRRGDAITAKQSDGLKASGSGGLHNARGDASSNVTVSGRPGANAGGCSTNGGEKTTSSFLLVPNSQPGKVSTSADHSRSSAASTLLVSEL
jgi:hypothetical protein